VRTKKKKVNQSFKSVLEESDKIKVCYYIDTVGNQEEEIKLETITITTDSSRTWLRKHNKYVKGEEFVKGEKNPNPLSLKQAGDIWRTYLP